MNISIIIPVFNAEKYLDACLKSVLRALEKAEKFKGEILTVDNGSTDNSLAILKEYQKKFNKIISVLHCNTPGASSSRNLGAKKAHGEYIWFIDADDTIGEDAVLKLVSKANETGAELVMMGAERTSARGEVSYLSAVCEDEKDYKSRFVRYGMGPWQVMIQKKWWDECNFSFREGIIHEDMELMSALILYTDKFASVDEPLYFYHMNPESVLHKSKFSPRIFDIFPALEGVYQRFVDKGVEKEYRAELEWFFIWNLLIDSAKDFAKFKEGRPGFARSREMLRKYFPDWRQNKFLRQKPLKLQIRVRLNYYK